MDMVWNFWFNSVFILVIKKYWYGGFYIFCVFYLLVIIKVKLSYIWIRVFGVFLGNCFFVYCGIICVLSCGIV